MEEEKRKLIKFSNYSLCITLPKSVIKSFNWKKGDLVNLEADLDSKRLIISANKNKKSKTVHVPSNEKKSNQLRW